jgi:hypothetical protein
VLIFACWPGDGSWAYIRLQRNRAWLLMTGAGYNLIRIATLDAQAA